MRYIIALLLLCAPVSYGQTFSQTYTVGTSAPTVLDTADLDVIEDTLPDAVAETAAAAGYQARVDSATAARTPAIRRLLEATFRAQSPRYAASVASVSTVAFTLAVDTGDLETLTISSATPLTTRTYTVGAGGGAGGFTAAEGEVCLFLARRAQAAIQAVTDATAGQAAHVVRKRTALRVLLRALATTGKTAYPGPVAGVTSLTVVREAGAVVSVTISGD